MATLEEIYTKALSDEAEREAFAKAAPDAQALAAFLQERGCDATPEAARAFLDEQTSRTGELAVEELATVAGGGGCGDRHCPKCNSTNVEETSSGLCSDSYRCKSCGYTWSQPYTR